jgi:outer membrane protein OmpA-like peptidoglycan-associated protein
VPSAHPGSAAPDPSSDRPRDAHGWDAASAAAELAHEEDAGSQEDAASDAGAYPSRIAIYGAPTVHILTQIPFSRGETTTGEEVSSTLRAIAEAMHMREFVVDVEGHADPTEKQPGISLRRAKHVRDRLVQLGVEPGRLNVVDHGATRPLDRTSTKVNARVTFRVNDGDAPGR